VPERPQFIVLSPLAPSENRAISGQCVDRVTTQISPRKWLKTFEIDPPFYPRDHVSRLWKRCAFSVFWPFFGGFSRVLSEKTAFSPKTAQRSKIR
jgi:hypothetical protein